MSFKFLARARLFQQPPCFVPANSFSTSRVGLSNISSRAPSTGALTKLPQHVQRFRAAPAAWKAIGLTGLGLGASLWMRQTILCEPVPPQKTGATPNSYTSSSDIPPPPDSAVNLYELSFGTVAGLCAGVFVKKGAKMLAFVFGGVFVLLQYLGSASLIKIDWGRAAKRFEGLFYTTDAAGVKRPPTVYSLWNSLVSFLVADFQARASFLGGFMLGLRVG
ncbi:hypothetical protein PQX77_004859 [Marasmius sp. AFHP31]|nr:hypothetical protein PQX77_004859 [Marasmius sp. AFHP31]